MTTKEAQQLVQKTFQNSFDKNRFVYFIKNLLNEIDESKKKHFRGYVHEKYKDKIKTYERIGTYTDTESNKIDILIVYLRKKGSIDQARTTLRNFVGDYLKERGKKEAGLVAFVSPDQKDWRFSLVKMEYKITETLKGQIKAKEEFTPAKRYSFLVGVEENSHTAQSQLVPILEDDTNNPTLEQLERAFNIEKVTKEFFEKYHELFLKFKESLDKVIKEDKKVKKDFEEKDINAVDFTKKLLGQIVFLYFLQKKGWFGVRQGGTWGSGSKNFLRELFEEKHGGYKNFFNEILEPLFYEALRNDRSHDDHYFSMFKCKIPFLNGGLFDPIKNYDWQGTDLILPNELFSNETKDAKTGDVGTGILNIFDRYNFTVKEDEPLEKEVAIDPEMLGKVFENLLEVRDRKSKGTYYTPREIVHYMCQESLINYLATELNGNVSKEDIETLVKYGESAVEHETEVVSRDRETKTYSYKLPEGIRKKAELIDEKLGEIKVCDPAVGSGAFLVSMMNEIVRTRYVLNPYLAELWTMYDFKREAIQNSLYGVDIDPGAVEIAKLRLWLSLIVDEADIKKIQPLPNLGYRIMQGNSLVEEYEGINFYYKHEPGSLFENQDKDLRLKQLEKKKNEYFNTADVKKKNHLKEEIDSILKGFVISTLFERQKAMGPKSFKVKYKFNADELAERISDPESTKPFFLWKFYFSEVFNKRDGKRNGFDVVIANPPYVRIQSLPHKEIDYYKSKFRSAYKRLDISVLFMELAFNLMRKNGYSTYITTSQFTKTEYGRKIRELLLNDLVKIVYFGDNQVFESATNYTSLFFFSKELNNNFLDFINAEGYLGEVSLSDFIKTNAQTISKNILSADSWELGNRVSMDLLNKIRNSGKKILANIANVEYGLVTGLDKVLVFKQGVNRGIEDSVYVHPLLKPFNTDKYLLIKPNYYVIYPYESKNGYTVLVNEDDLSKKSPRVYKYLLGHKKELLDRKDSRQDLRAMENRAWYSLIRYSSFQKVSKEKILTPALSKHNEFCLDKDGHFFTGGSIYSIATINNQISNFALLGLLNSKVVEFYFRLTCPIRQHGYRFYAGSFLKKLPIPEEFFKNGEIIAAITKKILAITKSGDYLENPTKQVKVKEYEKQIDQMVYKLYGLTKEEIKIIENI
ncbi:BREX-1 system adenine-specific DNA-methyltransferase PglX [Candidatus Parcubacteria bacterium]|nr:BREX-1 system adenine-specific DNA-methyltransferase PglX [Candidatus Parcubacteria bacterium]